MNGLRVVDKHELICSITNIAGYEGAKAVRHSPASNALWTRTRCALLVYLAESVMNVPVTEVLRPSTLVNRKRYIQCWNSTSFGLGFLGVYRCIT